MIFLYKYNIYSDGVVEMLSGYEFPSYQQKNKKKKGVVGWVSFL